MDAMEKAHARSDNTNLLSLSAIKAIAPASQLITKPLYHHWRRRRESRPISFLRIFQPPPDPKNHDAAVAFRPRERDAASGIARRMNTYDNFRKALILRDQLRKLRHILHRVQQREQNKSQLLAINMLAQRLRVTADGGARMDAVNRAVFTCDTEPAVTYGSSASLTASTVIIPVRGLNLPQSIPVVSRKMGADKMLKKNRRKLVKPPEKTPQKEGSPTPSFDSRAFASAPSNLDKYGYDYHGNYCLKHMRYFAGGFANYGVSPYDHRVFAAATERNTVRASPREPHPVTIPSASVKFARFGGRLGGSGAKTGPRRFVTTHDIARDILNTSPPSASLPLQPARKMRRTIRARARVGRGGRIMFDRVVFERQRGLRAASYPGNVEMGGVYTAGIPFHEATRVAAEYPRGDLGDVMLLGGGHELRTESLNENRLVQLAKELIPEMEPMTKSPDDMVSPKDVRETWPRRRGAPLPKRSTIKWFDSNTRRNEGNMDDSSDRNLVQVVPFEDWDKLPAYAPKNDPLVSEL
eukprot:gb/GEZJ01003472.1/.p1 GENE.gb/GEZJ01003472.1/~~gb/GEZJ01003472.1/.p1  ORF type:complete len:525 (-),score=66.90 gb/GEZJ01003472.1/:1509-3083(-)